MFMQIYSETFKRHHHPRDLAMYGNRTGLTGNRKEERTILKWIFKK
jgi:hypothetical protein